MRALIRKLWTEHRARKYARARYREELTDRREAEHLERQRGNNQQERKFRRRELRELVIHRAEFGLRRE